MTTDFSNLDIEQCKLFANSEAYFKLFEKHLTGSYNKCLLYMIGNIETIANIMRKNEKATYYIYDNGLVVDCLKAGMPDWKKFHVMQADSRKTTNEQLWNGVKKMKFDKIIMNPPYSKNLHLKVLAEAIEHLTDDGECVNLSPIRWLQDPLAKYKKNSDYNRFEDSVCKHIEDIEMITANDSERIFNIRFPFDLGIYFISRKMAFISYTLLNKNILSIISKVMKYSKQIGDHIEKNKVDGFRVRINAIGGGAHPNDNGKLDQKNILHNTNSWVFENGYQNGIYWTEVTGTKNQYSKKIGDPFPTSINFSTLNSANNFEKCTKTDFMHFLNVICKLDMNFVDALPWLGDAINPRTGKKGYESEWTNEDFYKFFNIIEDEQRLIEETMEKYK